MTTGRAKKKRKRRRRRLRFKCVACGKITAGRLPRNPNNHREVGNGTFYYPRRHRVEGVDCPGNLEEAEWV